MLLPPPMERQRSGASLLSVRSDDAAYSASAPPLPLYPSPETLAPHLDLPEADLQPLLRHAWLFAARNAEVDLVQWLLDLPADVRSSALPPTAPDPAAEDGEGGAVVLAVIGSAGREDREDCVRALVRAVGVGGADSSGWTALHHAALLSTPPLISFLLTAGADPHALTLKGLTPLDIVTDLPAHADQTALLTTAMTSPPVQPPLHAPLAFGSPSAISEAAFPASSSSSASSARDPIAPAMPPPRAPGLRRQSTATALPAAVARAQLHRRAENRRRVRLEKERWMADVASVAGVEPRALLDRCWEDEEGEVDEVDEALRKRQKVGRQASVVKETTGWASDDDDSSEGEDDADGFNPHEPPPYHSFLVFSLPTLPSLLDTLIASYAPHAHPRAWRAAPANAIFLFARFALYRCDDEWLEELIVGVVDRVEKSVYDNVDDLAHLAFWIYNSTLLFHLLRQDPGLDLACHELNLFIMLEELINAIHVFVIRFIERRVDGYLDAALLDYEPMSEEFAGLAFEGEWSFLRNLTGRGTTTAKKAAERMVPRAKDMFASATSSPARAEGEGGWPGNGEAGRQRSQTSSQQQQASGGESGDATLGAGRPVSVGDASGLSRSFSSTSNSLFASAPSPPPALRRASDEPPPPQGPPAAPAADDTVTPRTLTTFLTSSLVVLQLYEVNPAVICQALSQCYYWIGCEAFNRILTRRRYLCRSKAVQIRMNLTALEDWLRDAALPVRIATRHLEPVNQLLQWLQTCSSLDDFDSLIVMLSSLRSLNPLQMRRAVKDYRFEVGEGRMSDECGQYLAQLQKDWDKRRVRIGVETLQREVSEQKRLRVDVYGSHDGPSTLIPAEDRPYNPALLEPATPVDLLFDPDVPLGQYNPPSAPESLGELLDSRFMLPFTLPHEVDLLAATPPKGAAFALLLPSRGGDGSANGAYLPALPLASPRPSSRSSFASLRPLRFASRRHQPTNELPLEFLEWLDEEERAKAPRERRLGSVALSGDHASLHRSSTLLADPPAPVHDPRTPTGGRHDEGYAADTYRPGASSSHDSTLVAGGGSSSRRSPPTVDVDDFGSRRGSTAHERGDSEQTISSHGRDGSDATVKRKPGRLASLIVDDGGVYRPTTTVDRGDDEDDARTPVATTTSSQPASPTSAKGWFKSLPRRKGTFKALINGGGGGS